jgi:CII-binding regulator of phage lambda lysogenization HflD
MANLVNCLIAKVNMLRKKVDRNDDEIEVLEKKLKKSENIINNLQNKVDMLCAQQASLMENQDNLLSMQNVLEQLNMGEASEFIQNLQVGFDALLDQDGNPIMLISESNDNDGPADS